MASNVDELYRKRREAYEDAHSLKAELEETRPRIQLEIESLQAEADALAAEWRPMVQRSKDAYNDGDFEDANFWSNEYKPLRDRCKSLNEKAQAKRLDLKALRQAMLDAFAEAKLLEAELQEAESSAAQLFNHAHGVQISSFDQVSGLMNADVADLISELPESIWRHIRSIEYIDEPREGERDVRAYAHIGRDGPIDLVIARHVQNEDRGDLIHAIVHESAHVHWARELSAAQKKRWQSCHDSMKSKGIGWPTKYSEKSAEELFCECAALFVSEEHWRRLENGWPKAYDLICKAMESLQ